MKVRVLGRNVRERHARQRERPELRQRMCENMGPLGVLCRQGCSTSGAGLGPGDTRQPPGMWVTDKVARVDGGRQ